MRPLVLVCFFMTCLFHAKSQDSFPAITFSGNVRVRGEIDMRDFDQSTPPNTFTLLRARLGMEARPVEFVKIFLQVQDSRVFGQEKDPSGSFNTLAHTQNVDLHQGYFEIQRVFLDALSVRIGRQEISYGNERMIGSVGWNNVGRSFDGIVLKYGVPDMTIDAFAATLAEVQSYPSSSTPASVRSQEDRGADLVGLYASTGGTAETYEAYIFHHQDRNQSVPGSSDIKRTTMGARVAGVESGVDYEVEAAYQAGWIRGRSLSAYLLAVAGGYRTGGNGVQRTAVGCDVLSGTPSGATNERSFDPAFHTGHKFYGFMDYFVAIPAQTQGAGLIDLYGRLTAGLSQNLKGDIWVHHFLTHEGLSVNPPAAPQRTLGQEVDCVVQYRYNTAVTFELGTSAFFPGIILRERFGGASTGVWAYLAAAVSF